MAVTCGPGGIGWVGDSHVWTRWYRVGGWQSRVDQVV